MQTSPLYEQALAFATRYHEGQVRKNALAEPYITHPVGVAQLLMEAGIKSRGRKERRDAAAAAFILQGYLDSLKACG